MATNPFQAVMASAAIRRSRSEKEERIFAPLMASEGDLEQLDALIEAARAARPGEFAATA